MDFNDVFSMRRPQNVMAGVSSGLQSVGKGILAGDTVETKRALG
jgi:hypothetical protein